MPGEPGWYVPVLAWLGLAWAALADAMTVFIAVIPLALVCAVRVGHGVARDREPLAAWHAARRTWRSRPSSRSPPRWPPPR